MPIRSNSYLSVAAGLPPETDNVNVICRRELSTATVLAVTVPAPSLLISPLTGEKVDDANAARLWIKLL